MLSKTCILGILQVLCQQLIEILLSFKYKLFKGFHIKFSVCVCVCVCVRAHVCKYVRVCVFPIKFNVYVCMCVNVCVFPIFFFPDETLCGF